MKIEISNGELVDKLSILEIKLNKIQDKDKLKNIRKEYSLLEKAASLIINRDDPLYRQLLDINQKLSFHQMFYNLVHDNQIFLQFLSVVHIT